MELSKPNEKFSNTNQFDSCVLISSTKLLSKKWIGFIFCQLFENEELFFNDLKNGIKEKSREEISSSALSQTLKDLENHQIIERKIDQFSHPPRTLYTLTEKGKEMRIIFALIKKWSTKWETKSNTNRSCCVVQYLPEIGIKLDILD